MPTISGYCYRRSGTIRAFPSLWHLCPVRTECEDATAASVVGTLTAPMCQEHGWTALATGTMALLQSFSRLWQLAIRRPLCLVFSVALPTQAFRGLPWLGSFSVAQHRHIKGHKWMGSYSGVQCAKELEGPAFLLFSCWYQHVGRETLQGWLHPLPVTQQYCLASVAAWFSSTGISHQSPPSHPRGSSPHSQQQTVPWDCSTTPAPQLPAAVSFRGPCPHPGHIQLQQGLCVWFAFCLDCHK